MKQLKLRQCEAVAAVYDAINILGDSDNPDDRALCSGLAWIVDAYLQGGLKDRLARRSAERKRKSLVDRAMVEPSRN